VIAAHEAESLQAVELQHYCAARIPKYMIPEHIEFRESLPKTSTGKIDRVQLVTASS
jgi:acyl-coenzyme A synthetase/AMP-(fatty) acid ligase